MVTRDAARDSDAAGLERAAVLGTGLIGGSVAAALRVLGVTVTGWDLDPTRAARAVEVGAIDSAASAVARMAGAEKSDVLACPRRCPM